MSSPFPTLALCIFYAYFSKILAPKLMANRKPFDLRNILVVYNLFQTIFSAWIFYEVSMQIELQIIQYTFIAIKSTVLIKMLDFNCISLIYSLNFQYLRSGWWGHYSFKCQPVDYSNNTLALRVSPYDYDNCKGNNREKITTIRSHAVGAIFVIGCCL